MKLNLAWLMSLLLGLALTGCTADTTEQLNARPPYSPWPDFTKFTIASDLSSQQLTDTLYMLFQQHPVLRDELPCHRYSSDNTRFGCLKVIREDVFSTRFESDNNTLTFSIMPRTFDTRYKPDYRHFRYLGNEIAQMLIAHFGKANVAIK